MTRMVVARTGLGRLHIAAPMPGGQVFATICGKTLRGPKITTWRAGNQASAVWADWARCSDCTQLERKWGR